MMMRKVSGRKGEFSLERLKLRCWGNIQVKARKLQVGELPLPKMSGCELHPGESGQRKGVSAAQGRLL